MDPIEFDFMMGVDLHSDERRLMKGHVRRLKNLVPVAPGMLAKRRGVLAFGSSVYSTFGSDMRYVPQCMAVSDSSVLPQFVVCGRWVDPGPAVANVHAFTPGSMASPLSYAWPVVPGRTPSIVQFGGKVYIFPGTGIGHAGAILQESSPGVSTLTAFDFNGTGNGYAPAVACIYRQRLAAADFGPGKENWLVLSNDYDPATIGNGALTAINGRALKIGADGERITALVDIMLTAVGSPAQSALLILKENSAFMMTGELDQTTGGTDDAVLNEIGVKAGCAGWTTVARSPHGLFWAGSDDVWFFREGQVPVPIGRKILPALKNTPVDFRYKWHAAYFDGFYRLAIAAPGQGIGPDSRCGEQWWLDLRDGPPASWEEAKWYGPMVIKDAHSINTAAVDGTTVFAVETRRGQAPALYGAARMGSGDLALYSYDAQDGYDETAIRSYNEIDDQWDNEIGFELHTGTYDFGVPTRAKTVSRVELDARAAYAARLEIKTVIDGGVGGKTALYRTDGALPQFSRNGFVVGADALDSTYLTREFESLIAVPQNGSRLAFKQLKLELSENQGYLVDEDNDTFRFSHKAAASPFTRNYTSTLTRGLYTSLLSFLEDCLIPAMNTAIRDDTGLPISGVTFSQNVAAQNHGAVAITASSGAWSPGFGGDRDTRIIGTQLGFDTAASYSLAGTHTATSQTRWRESPAVELASMILAVRLIPRRAT